MTSMPCDIVILPASELAQKAISASKQLQQFGALYRLADGVCYPHASLYMTQLKSDDLGRAKQLLADIAVKTSVLELTATRYYQAERYIDVEYTRTSELVLLQNQVVAAINPIRDGMRANDQARLATTTGTVRENLEKYGYRGVGELFRPHLSLTRFEQDQPDATDNLPRIPEFNGQFTRLGLFEMGDNGTCVRKIAEFELGH